MQSNTQTKVTFNILGEDQNGWIVDLQGLPEEIVNLLQEKYGENALNLTIEDIDIRRQDGKFFEIKHNHGFGYGQPFIFQKIDKSGISGTVSPVVRKNPDTKKWYIGVEKNTKIKPDGTAETCTRAFRASVSAPEGLPLPKGTTKIK